MDGELRAGWKLIEKLQQMGCVCTIPIVHVETLLFSWDDVRSGLLGQIPSTAGKESEVEEVGVEAMGKGRDPARTLRRDVHLPLHRMRDGMRQTGEMLLLNPLLFLAPVGSGMPRPGIFLAASHPCRPHWAGAHKNPAEGASSKTHLTQVWIDQKGNASQPIGGTGCVEVAGRCVGVPCPPGRCPPRFPPAFAQPHWQHSSHSNQGVLPLNITWALSSAGEG